MYDNETLFHPWLELVIFVGIDSEIKRLLQSDKALQ